MLGQVCGIVGNMDVHGQEFRKLMDDVNFMMGDRGLPRAMKQRIRSYFLSTRDVQRHLYQRQILQRMSPDLQGDVAMTINRPWISKVSFLRDLLDLGSEEQSPRFVVDIALSLNTEVFAQGEVFGKPQVLYILNKGVVVNTKQVLRSGSVWGEDFVLTDTKLQATIQVLALTYVEILTLERACFLAIVEKHRDTFPQLVHRVRRFCARLAAQRAILAEAQRRRSAISTLALEVLQLRGEGAPRLAASAGTVPGGGSDRAR